MRLNYSHIKSKMIAQLALLVFSTLAVSANPAANKPWHWVHRQIIVDPKTNRDLGVHVVEDLEPKRPTPKVAQDVIVVSDCGQAPLAPVVNGIIVGGAEAPPHSLPWQVALYIDYMYFCGGSVISDEWVMTAAHCMDGAQFVEIVAGANDLSKEEASQVTMTSTDFFVHEKWSRYFIRNDIAMIHLPRKLIFNDYIQPVCLPFASESDLGAGDIVTSSGWGETRELEGNSRVLMKVQNPTISNTECQRTYGSKITPELICTNTYGGKGTCDGDSGGPLNYKTGTVTETRGIVSFGSSAGCKAGYPDAFTRVTHYLDWIKKNTGVTRS